MFIEDTTAVPAFIPFSVDCQQHLLPMDRRIVEELFLGAVAVEPAHKRRAPNAGRRFKIGFNCDAHGVFDVLGAQDREAFQIQQHGNSSMSPLNSFTTGSFGGNDAAILIGDSHGEVFGIIPTPQPGIDFLSRANHTIGGPLRVMGKDTETPVREVNNRPTTEFGISCAAFSFGFRFNASAHFAEGNGCGILHGCLLAHFGRWARQMRSIAVAVDLDLDLDLGGAFS